MKILNPKSSESWIPFVVIDRKVKFGFILQVMTRWGLILYKGKGQGLHFIRDMKGWPPFGLYIRLPFILFRWGAA
jgi:hypothetical protein